MANNSVFCALIAFVTAPWNIVLVRFMSGFGVGAVMPCISALVVEHASAKCRGFYANAIDSQWTTGFIYTAVLAFAFLSGSEDGHIWRKVYSLGIAAPQVAALLLVYFYVPESVRFLALHGQYKQATNVANSLARSMSFRGDPLTEDEVEEHYPIENIREASPSFLESLSKSKASYLNLYVSKELRRRVLSAQAVWFLLYMGYGVGQWVSRIFEELEVVENIFLNSLIFAVGAVPGIYLASVAVEKLSRNMFLRGSLLVTLISSAVFTVLAYTANSTIVIVVSSAAFHSCLITCWSSVSLVTTEAFATDRRSAVLGACTASGMLGLATMNLLSALLLNRNMPIVLLGIGTACIATAIVLCCVGLLQAKDKGANLLDRSTMMSLPESPQKEPAEQESEDIVTGLSLTDDQSDADCLELDEISV